MKFKFILKLLYKWKLILILIEFIEHYKKYKVDKIIIYDNNDLNSENLDFLRDYTKNSFLEIIDYRGKIAPQLKAYHECYYKNHNEFAWYLFVDIDEFINSFQIFFSYFTFIFYFCN